MKATARGSSLRIENWNYAGTSIFLGLVLGPLLIGLVVWMALGGGIKNKVGELDWPLTLIFGGTFLAVGGMLIYNALASSVLWIEVGDRLRYRRLLGFRTREWHEVRAVEFEDEPRQLNTKIPGVSIPLGSLRVFVVLLADGSELRAKVSSDQEREIRGILDRLNRRAAPGGEGGGGIEGKDDGFPRLTVHYLFAHKMLPSIAFQDPAGFLACVLHPEGPDALRVLWERIRVQCGAEDEPAPSGFPVHRFMLGEMSAVIIELPEPRQVTEAHFVAFAARLPRPEDEPRPASPAPTPARYFTLEKGAAEFAELIRQAGGTLLGSYETILGAWTPDGSHENHGPGPAPRREEFARALVERFAGGPGSGEAPMAAVVMGPTPHS